MEFLLIFISAIFVNNIVLSQFLGICPFLGVSKKVETALGMSAAVAFVMTLATIVTYVLQKFVLDAFGLAYLQTIAFILVIAALVQMVEIVMKKVSCLVSGAGHLLASYHYQLCCAGCGNPCYPERLLLAAKRGICPLFCNWLWCGTHRVCGHT